MLVDSFKAVSRAEDKRYTPYACDGNYGIDHSADHAHGASADPSYDIKVKKSYASPVKSTDNGKNKSYSVYYHFYDLFFLPNEPTLAFGICKIKSSPNSGLILFFAALIFLCKGSFALFFKFIVKTPRFFVFILDKLIFLCYNFSVRRDA